MRYIEATLLEKRLGTAIKKLASKWRAVRRSYYSACVEFEAAHDGSPEKESASRLLIGNSSKSNRIASACTLLTSEHIRLSRALSNNIGDHVAFRLDCGAMFELDRLSALLK